MEGLSPSSFKRDQKEVKHIPGVLHPRLQWCRRKVGWTDSQNICRLWRTFLLKSDEKKPWSNTKAWAGKLWSNFSYLNRSARSGYRALNKHIFKRVASKIFLICAVWWWVRAQLGIDPKSGCEPGLGQYSLVMFCVLPLSEPSVWCSWAQLNFWSHSSKEIMPIFSV